VQVVANLFNDTVGSEGSHRLRQFGDLMSELLGEVHVAYSAWVYVSRVVCRYGCYL
jgi:hypothetical protein